MAHLIVTPTMMIVRQIVTMMMMTLIRTIKIVTLAKNMKKPHKDKNII